MAGNLGTASGPDLLLHPMCELLQCVLIDRAALAGPAHPIHDLVPAERLRHPGALHDGEHGLLDGGEAARALGAGSPTADHLPLVDFARIHHPGVRVPTEWAPHPLTPFPTASRSACCAVWLGHADSGRVDRPPCCAFTPQPNLCMN